MSIFYDIATVLHDLASLVLPRTCLACGRVLTEDESGLCLACRYNMPLTEISKREYNPVKALFENAVPIESATSLYWFMGGTEWQRLIHNFKYHGRWYFAQKMGELLGKELAESGKFDGVEVVVPIPLHYHRRLMRGYNQSEQLAIGVGRRMGVECDLSSVCRLRYNDSQTTKRHYERWGNVADIFAVRNVEKLRGKHILLIDDVLTTGATISSCAKAIFKACEGDVRISVATLALSRKIVSKR